MNKPTADGMSWEQVEPEETDAISAYVVKRLGAGKSKRTRSRSQGILCDSGEVVFNYADYLKTEHWIITRERALNASGGLCMDCKVNEATQVHHLHYNTLGRENRLDLLPLCERCHKLRHGDAINEDIEPMIAKAADKLRAEKEELDRQLQRDFRKKRSRRQRHRP